MKLNDLQTSDLILRIEQDPQNMYFLQNNHKFRKATLNSYEQEEFFVSDDPIPESLSSWIELSIQEDVIQKKKIFDISYKSNGLTADEKAAIENLINQVRLALKTGMSVSLHLSSFLNLSEWAINLE